MESVILIASSEISFIGEYEISAKTISQRYPIPKQKWIIRTTKSGKIIHRRKSPKKGKLTDLFYELVSFPHLITEDNFSIYLNIAEPTPLRNILQELSLVESSDIRGETIRVKLQSQQQ